MKVSAIILTRNEEKNIKKCLESLSFASEIIVVDNGSNDATVQIAREFTSKILTFTGTDFSAMRMLGAKKAHGDWLFYIDADERVTSALESEIKNLAPYDYSAFTLIRENFFYQSKWPKTDQMIRLIKKDKLINWVGMVHETPSIQGKVGFLQNSLYHYTHEDISKMVEKTNKWSEIEAGLRLKSNHPPIVVWRLIRVMSTAFFRSLITEKGYIKGTLGFIESIYQSYSIFVTYAKLWELQNQLKKS